MFKNREISIQLSKDKKNENLDATPKEEVSFNDKMATAMYVGKQITYRVGGVVAAYIILDTWRQVQVNKSSTHIHLHD